MCDVLLVAIFCGALGYIFGLICWKIVPRA